MSNISKGTHVHYTHGLNHNFGRGVVIDIARDHFGKAYGIVSTDMGQDTVYMDTMYIEDMQAKENDIDVIPTPKKTMKEHIRDFIHKIHAERLVMELSNFLFELAN